MDESYMKSFEIIKASGEREPFDIEKLRYSMANSGAGEDLIETVISDLEGLFKDGVTTQKIYREAYRLLRKHSSKAAGRYKLKEAILELGPTGFPFEKFIGELLKRMGYETEVGVTVEGNCVSHEIDVLAQKGNEHYMIECKFHNRKENRCNVHIPLCIQSRFLDVKENWTGLPGHKDKKHQGWVVTNTRFTRDAQTYGECIGLKLLSWDYPKRDGLKDLIARVNLHPITCLSTLSKAEKQQLLEENVIFAMQIIEDVNILKRVGIESRKAHRVQKEAADICNHTPS
jgi:hypothetical protein